MNTEIIKTETETVIIIPRDPPSLVPTRANAAPTQNGTYTYRGVVHELPEEVLTASYLWAKGKTAAEIAEGCKLKVKGRNAFDADSGQRLLGAIRRVLPGLLPTRRNPNRRHQ